MHCIFCGNKDTDVVETRTSDDGMTVRRRRECSKCVKRFTTYESLEELPLMVIKNDGRREPFSRTKILNGLIEITINPILRKISKNKEDVIDIKDFKIKIFDLEFDREKLKSGIVKSTGKTTITLEQVEEIVNNVESDLKQEDTTEVESQKIGENVAKYLKKLDKIAYIRFASVFRRFVDVEDFEKEVKKLL